MFLISDNTDTCIGMKLAGVSGVVAHYKCGFKIKEVPVIFVNRELGTSKMNSSIFGEAMFGVMRLRWDGWFRKYPKKC